MGPAQALNAAHPLVHEFAHGLGGLLLLFLGTPVTGRRVGKVGGHSGGLAGHVQGHFVRVAASGRAGLRGARPQQPLQRWQALGRGADAFKSLGALGLRLDGFFNQGRACGGEVDGALRAARYHRADGDGREFFPSAGGAQPCVAG